MLKKTRIEQLLTEGKSSAEIAEIIPCTRSYANQVKSKLNIVNGTEQMVEHHISYKEIHGVDKTVWMTRSEHSKLHQRLRKTGKCNVLVDKLYKIAVAAHARTDTAKGKQAKYQKQQKCIEYEGSPGRTKYKRDYHLKNTFEKNYWTYMMPYISHKATIGYNVQTTKISVSSGFYGSHKKKPLVVNII